ncbi:MAG: hypothetical protein HDR03_15125 [Lachnospiraceae bacterium]|nr:hypothetical protein [Lachnospiraceae bacterium]
MPFKIKNSKILWCCLIALQLLILCVAGVIYSRREDVQLNYAQEDLVYNNGESGFYLDKSSGYKYIATPEITLPKGLYTLSAQCECAKGDIGSKMDIIYSDGEYDSDVSGFISIANSTNITCDFRVKYADRPLIVRGRLTGDATDTDYILIRNISITTSAVSVRNFLFRIAVFFCIIDAAVFLYMFFFSKEKRRIDEETIFDIKVILLLIIFSSIPLMVNFLWTNAADLKFHLTRIEGLRQGLQNGTFPVKIQPYWLAGHGYAVSVFYGDVLLYIPAILRIFGVSIQTAYQFYVLIINAATVLIAYHCFSHMGTKRAGLICTVIYSLNIFRLYDVYSRAAVGEYTAIVFMPLVLYGLWKVYMLPEDSKAHERSWITITAGCTGIFLSHMISTEMTALFVILAVVIFWKKTIRKKNLLVLIKAAVATVLLNLWFLIPFVDYMFSGTYVINNMDEYVPYKLEEKGGFLAQLLINDYSVIGATKKAALGVSADMPRTVGLAAILVLAIWFIVCVGRRERNKAEKREEYFAVFACILSLIMTTTSFPYTWIVAKLPFLKMPIKSVQYSWRFLVVSGLMLSYLLCIVLRKSWIEHSKKKVFAIALVVISIWQGLSFMSGVLNESNTYRIYQAGGLNTFDIVFGEYIPLNWDGSFSLSRYTDAYVDDLTYNPDEISLEEWHRDDAAVVVSLTNNTENESMVEVPLLLYKGYHAYADTKEELAITSGESYRIAVAVPAGFSGSFSVEFKEPWYWRVCEIISLLTLVGVVFYMINIKEKRRR